MVVVVASAGLSRRLVRPLDPIRNRRLVVAFVVQATLHAVPEDLKRLPCTSNVQERGQD